MNNMAVLIEKEAEEFLERKGFRVAPRMLAKHISELAKIEKKIPFPWAIKISSKKVIHKAKVGGVLLNIKNNAQAEESFKKLSRIWGFEEALIQPMIESPEELILGLKKTPEFGIAVMVGKGGSKVEEEKDVSFRITPIKKTDAESMLNELKIKIKNKPEVISNILKLSELAAKNPKIAELDINPLMLSKGKSFVIDARIVLED